MSTLRLAIASALLALAGSMDAADGSRQVQEIPHLGPNDTVVEVAYAATPDCIAPTTWIVAPGEPIKIAHGEDRESTMLVVSTTAGPPVHLRVVGADGERTRTIGPANSTATIMLWRSETLYARSST